MKKVLFILGVLLSLGLFCACSKSDETTDDNNGEVKDWGTRPSDRTSWTSRGWIRDLTGYITYNEDLQLWHFISSWPYTEIYKDYYPIELSDEFKVDGLLVTIDVNLYWDEEEQREYIEITKIEKCSIDMEIMDRDGFFSMKTEECYSGCVTDAIDDEDRILAQIQALVNDGEEWIKVKITETPNSFTWLAPVKNNDVYFLKSDLQNPDIQVGDVVDFRIMRFYLLEHKHMGSDVYSTKFYCVVEPCK